MAETNGARRERSGVKNTYSVARASVIFTSLSLFRSLTNAMVLPVLVVVLARDEFGIIVLLTPLWWIAQSLFTLGANEGLARLCAREEAGTPIAVVETCLLAALLGAVAAAALSMSSETVLGIGFEAAVAWAIVVAVGQSIVSTTVGVLRATKNLPGATITLALATLLPPISGLTCLFVSTSSASYYLAGMAMGTLLAGFVGLVWVTRQRRFQFREGNRLARHAVKLGLPLLPSLLGALVVDAGLRRIALHFSSLEDLAVLGIALAVIGVLTTIVKSVFLAWSPTYFSTHYARPEVVLLAFSERLLAMSGALQAATLLGMSWAAPLISALELPPLAVIQVTALGSAAAVCSIPLLAATHLGMHRERTGRLALPVVLGNCLALVSTWWIVAATSWVAAPLALTASSLLALWLLAVTHAGLVLNRRILLLLGSSMTLAGATTLLVGLSPLWLVSSVAGSTGLVYLLLANDGSTRRGPAVVD